MSTSSIGSSNAIQLLADLLFAYMNKDEITPHDFELEALENAVQFLEREYKGETYTPEFFKSCKQYIQTKKEECGL